MDPQLPATTEDTQLPAVAEPAAGAAFRAGGSRQNVTTGLFPLALGLLLILFVALAFWTLMTTTGGGL